MGGYSPREEDDIPKPSPDKLKWLDPDYAGVRSGKEISEGHLKEPPWHIRKKTRDFPEEFPEEGSNDPAFITRRAEDDTELPPQPPSGEPLPYAKVAQQLINAAKTYYDNKPDGPSGEELAKMVTEHMLGTFKVGMGLNELGMKGARAIRDFSIIRTAKHVGQKFMEMNELFKNGFKPSDPEVVERATEVAGVIQGGTMFSKSIKRGGQTVRRDIDDYQGNKVLEQLGIDAEYKAQAEKLGVQIYYDAKTEDIVVLNPKSKFKDEQILKFGQDSHQVSDFLMDLELAVEHKMVDQAKRAEAQAKKLNPNAKPSGKDQTAGLLNELGLHISQQPDGNFTLVGKGALDGSSTHQSMGFGAQQTTQLQKHLENLKYYHDGFITGGELAAKTDELFTVVGGTNKSNIVDAAPYMHKEPMDTGYGIGYKKPFIEKIDDSPGQPEFWGVYDKTGVVDSAHPTLKSAMDEYDKMFGKPPKIEEMPGTPSADFKPNKAAAADDAQSGHTATGENKPFIVQKTDGKWVLFNEKGNQINEFGTGHAGMQDAQMAYNNYMATQGKSKSWDYTGPQPKKWDPAAEFDAQVLHKDGTPHGEVSKAISWKNMEYWNQPIAEAMLQAKDKMKLGDEAPTVIETADGTKYNIWYKSEQSTEPSVKKYMQSQTEKKNYPNATRMEDIDVNQPHPTEGGVIGYHARTPNPPWESHVPGGEYNKSLGKPSEFSLKRARGLGIHFGTRRQANSMAGDAGREGTRIYPAHLDIKNPFDMGSEMYSTDRLIKMLRQSHGDHPGVQEVNRIYQVGGQEGGTTVYKALGKALTDLGYDGLRYWNTVDDPGRGGYSYVVWEKGKVRPTTDPDAILFSNRGVPILPEQAKPNDKEGWLWNDFIKPFMDWAVPGHEDTASRQNKNMRELRQQYHDMIPDKAKKPTSLHKFLQMMDEVTDGTFKYAVGVLPGVRVRVPNPIQVHHTSPVGNIKQFEMRPLQGEGSAIKGDGIYLAENTGTRDYYKKVFEGRGQKGHRYDVNIHAKPDELLHMDLPIGQQGEIIKNAFPPSMHHMSGLDAYNAVRGQIAVDRGLTRYSDVAKATAEIFANRGVPGALFKDKYSRPGGPSASNPTHNYVIWVPEILEITKRYAAPLAIGAGGGIPLLKGAQSDDYVEEQ